MEVTLRLEQHEIEIIEELAERWAVSNQHAIRVALQTGLVTLTHKYDKPYKVKREGVLE